MEAVVKAIAVKRRFANSVYLLELDRHHPLTLVEWNRFGQGRH